MSGTNIGRIFFWIQKLKPTSDDPEDSWELSNINSISGTVKQLMWGYNLRTPLLGVNCVTKVYVMKEQTLCTAFSEGIWATQKTASQVLLETGDCSSLVHTEMQICNMSVNEGYIAFTNGRLISGKYALNP